jgi:AcrR family transcriptional regulator
MTPGGRRPGRQCTRAAILEAARASFAEDGYERVSLRAIARRAGVDPALVHHYFGGKPALFVEVLHMGRDPRGIVEEMVEDHAPGHGARLVRAFLAVWEERGGEDRNAPYVNLVQAVAASPHAADGLREFLTERVWAKVVVDEDPADGKLRRALVASLLFGVAWNRYLLRLEPFASATMDDVAGWVGPGIEAAMTATLSAPVPGPESALVPESESSPVPESRAGR